LDAPVVTPKAPQADLLEVDMKRRNIVIGTAVAAALGLVALGFGSPLEAQPYGGGGMMGGPGSGMMGGYGPGFGMMGGNGPGWMHGQGRGANAEYGPENCPRFQSGLTGPGAGQQGNLNLSTDDVKKRLEGWLTWQGNPRLKVGEVKEKDADTIEADIVTKDNSLVQRFAVDRHTGSYRPTED
jgi:hypothetical protein